MAFRPSWRIIHWLNTPLLADDFRTTQATLVVLARVDKVGVRQGQLDAPRDNVVDGLDTKHETNVAVSTISEKGRK